MVARLTLKLVTRSAMDSSPSRTPEQAEAFEAQVVSRRQIVAGAPGSVEGAAAQWWLDYWGRARG